MSLQYHESKEKIVFVGAQRTPFGTFGGALSSISATDLAVAAGKAALEQSNVPLEQIDHVIFGNVIPSASDAAYLARHIALKLGLPISTPAVTLNRLCGSGFEVIADGARRLLLNEADVVLVGGTENMSQIPFTLRKGRFGYRMGHGEIEDTLMTGLFDSYAQLPMALTAEKLAEKYQISREEVDRFALRSHQLASSAIQKQIFHSEITPVTVSSRTGTATILEDEHVRKEASLDSLAKLKPVFKKNGVVTAGNASGICDGAAALVMTTEKKARSSGWNILAYWKGSAVVGCDPTEMGIGPVPAIHRLMTATNLKPQDLQLVEINEAFAAQVLACQKELAFPEDQFNVDGGAIALGHPLGASGARLAVHLIHRLQRRGGGTGLGAACIGGGQGIAALLKVE